MSNLSKALEAITAQQPKEHSTVWGVGEQLKDILREQPELAELVIQDLANKDMSLNECEKKIKARADEIHKSSHGSGVCVTPMEADSIIRKFYGLPEPGEPVKPSGEKVIDLADFF